MKIKSILFLMATNLLFLTSCSQVGYFEGYNHKVTGEEFRECVEKFANVNCRNEEDKLNDFALTMYQYSEESTTTLFKDGVRSKESNITEVSLEGQYDLSNSIYHVRTTANASKETNSSTEKITVKEDYTYQNVDKAFYCFDNIYKTYEKYSNSMLCSDFVSDDFVDFQYETIYLMELGGQSAMGSIESVTCYKDNNVYTYEIKVSSEEDNEIINKKAIVQAMFTNKRCFLYSETLKETITEADSKKVTSKSYYYNKIEYNFKNISIKSVNMDKYNLD